jgi:hypothetical protein
MTALDTFISPICGFDSDIPNLATLVLTQLHSDESASDPSARASASASKTRDGKWKAATNPTP